MRKTNEQVISYAKRVVNQCGLDTEQIATRFGRYWVNNSLTPTQCQFLNEVQASLTGPSSIDGIYLDQGQPIKTKELEHG